MSLADLPLNMSARTPESLSSPPVPPCSANGTACAAPVDPLLLLSSTAVLMALVAVIAGVVAVSLATFYCHKSKMRKQKMRRAQEEYERDTRSPGAARRGKAANPGRCVVSRPVRRPPADPSASPPPAQQQSSSFVNMPDNKETRHTDQRRQEADALS